MSIASRPRRAANPAPETVTSYAAGRDGTPGKPLVPGQTPVGYQAGMLNPKFWDGMIAWAWFPLLWRNCFRIAPRRWIVVSAISLFSLISCALCNLGVPSPYLTVAFPNHPPVYEEYFDLEQVSSSNREKWKAGLMWFVKCLTVREPKRIVLKSPPHTFRIKTLLEMFPEARFVYVVRNPYVVFPSTVHLWRRLYRENGLQTPSYEGLEEYVFRTFDRMHETFERQRHLIPEGQLCEVRYEDLVAQPVEQMRALYGWLGLGEFEAVRPAIEGYFANKSDYQTNRYVLSAPLRAEVARRWKPYLEQYGYSHEPCCRCSARPTQEA